MKRFLILLSLLFCNVVYADTINLHWLNEDRSVYENSTCVVDSDLILPATPPTKYGYTFTGWKLVNYIPIEYLESTGTQWIDTGIVPDHAIKVTTRVFTKLNRSARWNFILGCNMNNHYGSENFAVSVFTYSGHNFYMGYITDHDTGVLAEYDTWYNIEIESNLTEQHLKIDDLTIYTQHATRYPETTSPIALFGCYAKDDGITWFSPIRMGKTKIYDNNTLVRDFIPVLDTNGVPCLFDRVEAKFYYNQGTGQFIAGPAL